MTKSILKSLLVGVLFGAAAFFMPKLLVAILLFGLVMKLLRSCCGRNYRFKMMDKIRSMSDEEYAALKASSSKRCCSAKCYC